MDLEAGFLIGFREALEAVLIVGVLISLLYRTGRESMAKWVWGGVILALIASLLTWQAFEIVVGEFSKKNEELFEGILYLVAAALITTVILHVIGHANREVLENKAEEAIETRKAFGIGLLAFVSVWREGVETVIFIGAGTESGEAITGLTILQSSAAFSEIDLPWPTNILPLSLSKSDLSIPGPRGLLPTKRQRFAPLNASSGLEVTITFSNNGNAQS